MYHNRIIMMMFQTMENFELGRIIYHFGTAVKSSFSLYSRSSLIPNILALCVGVHLEKSPSV